jgi:biotin synthase
MDHLRVSQATAAVLGLQEIHCATAPTTLYFLLSGPCEGRCAYCTHADERLLSRVRWPSFDLSDIRKRLRGTGASRLCIQCPHGDAYPYRAARIVRLLTPSVPVSASVSALAQRDLRLLKNVGVERVGMGLDCATPDLFDRWRFGTPSWDDYRRSLRAAARIFGSATGHVMAGLGETDEELIELIRELYDDNVDVALFAYFSNNETVVSRPRYRALQLARWEISRGGGAFRFDGAGRLTHLEMSSESPEAFTTSGCPGCNRPYYNERVTSIYNYPYIPDDDEVCRARAEARHYVRIRDPAQ